MNYDTFRQIGVEVGVRDDIIEKVWLDHVMVVEEDGPDPEHPIVPAAVREMFMMILDEDDEESEDEFGPNRKRSAS